MNDREEAYKKSAQNYWNETYAREGYVAANDVGSEKKTVDLALKEMRFFLKPSMLHDKLAAKLKLETPSFGDDYNKHPDFTREKVSALDFGTGFMGRYARALKKCGFEEVTGVDVSTLAIHCAAEANDGMGINFKSIDGVDLLGVVPESSIDFAFSNWVFQHIGAKDVIKGLVDQIFKVLKPGGMVRLEFAGRAQVKPDEHLSPYHGNGFTSQEIREVFEKCGYEVLCITEPEETFLWVSAVKSEEL